MALKKCKECGADISSKAKECPKCGAPQVKKRIPIFKLAFGAMFGYAVFVAATTYNEVTEDIQSSAPAQKVDRGPTPRQVALKSVDLDFSWNKIGFDNIMEGNFSIKNNSDFDIKDIEITCTHYAKSGTKIDSNTRVIYDLVSAKSTKKIEKFNMGFMHTQAEKTGCAITDLKV